MTVKVQGLHAMEELSVNVRGEWTPLGELAEQCGYRLERQDAEIIIAAPFITCGVTVKDGKYTLSLQVGGKTFTLACPVSPHEELSLTRQPVFNSPPHLTRRPAEHMPESLDPFPWAPPFYLAPPYYPHPTYQHRYPSPDERTADIPPTPSSSTPDPTVSPHSFLPVASQSDYQNYNSYPIRVAEPYTHFGVHGSLPSTVEAQDSGRVYPDLSDSPVLGVSERHSAARSVSSNTGLLIQVESPPPLQPPNHAFNPYYHYYHHPKIPLRVPPQDPYPGLEVPREVSLTNPNNPENLVLPHNMQQSEAQIPQASHPHTIPTSPPKASALYTPHPPDPYPNHYSHYFPHVVQGEAIRLAPLNPDTAAKANLPNHQNSKSNAFIHPLPCSSQVHDGYNLNTVDSQNADKIMIFQKNSPEGIKPPLFSELNVELDAPVAPAVQPPLPHTYPPRPSAVAAPPPEQPSVPTPSPNHNLPPYPYNPYYLYYQMYYEPEGLHDRVSPTSFKEVVEHLPRASSSPTRHSSYTNQQTTTPPTKPAHDVHNDPLHPYYHYYYSYYNTPQHPYDAFGRPGGEKAEERLDNEMKDLLGAVFSTPSASPQGLGRASYFDCSISLGCCSYPVKDCTMGQHLIFAMPDSVVEPSVAHPPEGSNVSCTLQKLTPDLYAVPLDGCGVSKHVFGQTVVYLLEVLALQQDHSAELQNSPIRLMVECISFPGFPSEVKLHVMDPPPPPPVPSTPSMGTLLLRIATDETFTSFHPEAHLPLSLMRGRSVYMEVNLLDPPEPGLVLLVHSCLAFTQAPYASWMPVYDGCGGDSQLLPSPRSNPHHLRRFSFSGFRSLDSESPEGGYSHLGDPEIYFLCLTEVCSAAGGHCTVGCINGPNGGV
ncbi:uncharacterized protein LOC117735212 [Cyclopterus lumpus]|uniref:uncharacterized protein LOC117735212 n=1 Tax=Cyclopterus lumpus TaxID=8103 RepID=UPI0014861EEB|nr:uncharacterized protein LOC117735212 [Cyclopterus lumpus]